MTEMLEEGNTPEQILEIILGDFGLEITDTLRQHSSVTAPKSAFPVQSQP